MKRLVLIPALLLGTLAMADQHKYEISPMIGYNVTEGNIGIKDNSYPVGGIELQFNTPNSKISPEFSVLYSDGVDYKNGGNTRIVRTAFNGVYTFDKMNSFVPFAKVGAGIEKIANETTANQDGFFMDAGAGAKVAFTDNIALKLEAIYLAKLAHQNAGIADSNLIALVGVTFAFGGNQQRAPEPTIAPEPAPEPTVAPAPEPKPVVVAPLVVDGDDDMDGVLNSMDKCPTSPTGTQVDAKGCKIDGDDDMDGVLNSMDKCPTSPTGTQVDAKGCKIDGDDDMDGVLNSVDECPTSPANSQVDAKGCPADIDMDGILNDQDICPNTEAGEAVNSDGCSKTVALHINFDNNSDNIKEESFANIDKYAEFLTTYTNYSAKIIGYTDSRGSAAYNQNLSQRRANAVRAMLEEKGVSSTQLSSVGMGEQNPIADNMTAKGRAENRRIEAELTRN